TWRSGYAAACKAVYTGSIPVVALSSCPTSTSDWPNAFEGGRVAGRGTVRDYWARQFEQVDPRVEPRRFDVEDDGRIAALVHQVVRDLQGTVLADHDVLHVYSFRDGRIARMDVIEASA